MIHSKYHKKNTNEDPKTSSVFETMLMLPDDLFWVIIREACFDNNNLPLVAGAIENYKFWPHWDSTGTKNSNFVEPDVFIRFQSFDLIIEAKYGDRSGQYSQQWENEITAYRNEYGYDKLVYFMAVGGNADKKSENVSLIEDIVINKCTWLSLLIQVTKIRKEYEGLSMRHSCQSAIIRLLYLIELAFKVHRVYNIRWFDEIRTEKSLVSINSLQTLKTYFK